MLRKAFAFLFLFSSAAFSKAQDVNYARQCLNVLASDSLCGRGYVRNGQERAAAFIQSEFKRLGLSLPTSAEISDGIQSFNGQVNTFPTKAEFKADLIYQRVGYDWNPKPNSGSIKGTFKPILIDSLFWSNPKSKELLTSYISSSKYIFLLKANAAFKKENSELLKLNIPIIELKETPQLIFSVADNQLSVFRADWKVDSTFRMPKKIVLNVQAVLKKHVFQNVMAMVPGKPESDSFVVFTAHYDHLGMVGNTVFNGANDNASGTAMLLDLAKFYITYKGKLPYNVLFIAFSGEEAGLLGSKYYTEHPFLPLANIKCLVNIDLMATGEDGITAVNAFENESIFARIVQINQDIVKLPTVGKRVNAPNSDHYPFALKKVPAIFIYAMGKSITAYHNPGDRPEKVGFAGYVQIFTLLTALCPPN